MFTALLLIASAQVPKDSLIPGHWERKIDSVWIPTKVLRWVDSTPPEEKPLDLRRWILPTPGVMTIPVGGRP